MRLKEIKPGMIIHCKNDEEKKALLEEAERLGYVWYKSKINPTEKTNESIGNTIHFHDASKTSDYKHITYSVQIGGNVIEFSDLIMPELTNEEAIRIKTIICSESSCDFCPIGLSKKGNESCAEMCIKRIKDVIEVLTQWKSEHEKKEPEIETVDICRIIEIKTDGKKRCVHEIDLNPDGEMLFKEQIEEILKRYCMEHEGEFIAVHEVVSRVKAVE